MNHTLQDYIDAANETVSTIRAQLTHGSNAAIDDKHSDHRRVFLVRAETLLYILSNQLIGQKKSDFPVIAYINSKVVQKYGYGQCAEQAQAAFIDLSNKGVMPIDFCLTSKGFHDLLVLGRAEDSDPNNWRTWGDKAVVCDVWANKVYPLSEFEKMQQDKEGGHYSSLTRNTLPHYLEGDLQILQSVGNEKELKDFKARMVLIPQVQQALNKKVESESDLQASAAELEQLVKNLKNCSLVYHKSALPYCIEIERLLADFRKLPALEKNYSPTLFKL